MRWILIISVMLLVSCEDPKDFSKDYKTRKIVDSLFRKELKVLKPKLNAQCSIRTNASVDAMVDSILRIRREEVEEILRREALENAKKQ